MYNLVIVLFAMSGGFWGMKTDTSARDTSNINYYQLKSGHIVYEMSGKREGTEEFYFDDWGVKEVSIKKTDIVSVFYSVKTVQKENSKTIIIGNDCYAIDLNKNTGVKTNFKPNLENTKVKSPLLRKINKSSFESNGAKKIGEGTILGKECEIWEAPGKKIWFWKDIPLKIISKSKYKNKNVLEAIKIDIENPIDSSVFSIPACVEIFDDTDYINIEE